MGWDDWDGDRLRVGPWVPGLGDRHRGEPVDVEPHPLRTASTAGRPPEHAEGSPDHDPVAGTQSPADGTPVGDAEPDPSYGGPETSVRAEVDTTWVATPWRRPIGRGLWAIGAVAALVGATVIALALRSSTPQPVRNGATKAIAGVSTTAAPPRDRSTPTPTSEVSASHAASNPPSASPEAQRYGPVGYEAEASSNILAGAASVSSYPGSSGGKIVANIGRWGPGAKRSGTLSFPDVSAPAYGVFTLALYLVADTDPGTRTIVITVSGAAPGSVTVAAASTCCVATTVRVTLAKGANTIALGNPDGPAPAIDRIVVSRP